MPLMHAWPLQEFQNMYNQMGAVWVASNLPSPPLDVRITSISGQSVTVQYVPV